MNLPALVQFLEESGIEEAVICSSINKIGYLMSPCREAYEETLKNTDRNKYQVMAMSVLASGAIPAGEAIEYIGKINVDSVVFGASSEKNIKETRSLIDKYIE